MNYAAFITDTTTGETRRYQLDATTPYGMGSRFWWAEGNYSCDCNRGPCFQRAGGVPEDKIDWEADKCSLNRPQRYRVSHLELDDGTRVEIDSETSPAGTFTIVVACTQVGEFFSAEGRLVTPPRLLDGTKDLRELLIVKAESRDRDRAVAHALVELAAKISGGR